MVLTGYEINMRRGIGLVCMSILVNFSLMAQDEFEINIANDFDILDVEWHDIARDLDNYDGFQNYCANIDFQSKTALKRSIRRPASSVVATRGLRKRRLAASQSSGLRSCLRSSGWQPR